MKIKLKKANVKRLASLSALGAGALGVCAGPADASSIVYSGILDEQIGFSRKSHRSATFAGPNGVGALLLGRTSFQSQGGTHSIVLRSRPGAGGTGFRFQAADVHVGYFLHHTFALAFPLGAEWGTAAPSPSPGAMHANGACAANPAGKKPGVTAKTVSRGVLGATSTSCFNSPGAFTFFKGNDTYLLFEFTGGKLDDTLYGWAQLDVKVPKFGGLPKVTLVDWAYDNSGAEIPAGDTGTPEPSTFALTGLAALALGARGLRSWRAARKRMLGPVSAGNGNHLA